MAMVWLSPHLYDVCNLISVMSNGKSQLHYVREAPVALKPTLRRML